jgi:hypothetical protein
VSKQKSNNYIKNIFSLVLQIFRKNYNKDGIQAEEMPVKMKSSD